MQLKESLQSEGYRPNTDLWGREIAVAIGRDGRMYHMDHDGKHQLAVAQLLDIDSVIVQVRAVHPQWCMVCCSGSDISMLESVLRNIEALPGVAGSRAHEESKTVPATSA